MPSAKSRKLLIFSSQTHIKVWRNKMSQSWVSIVIKITDCKHLNSGISLKVERLIVGAWQTCKYSVVRPKFNFQTQAAQIKFLERLLWRFFMFEHRQSRCGRCEDLHHFSILPDRKQRKKCFRWQVEVFFPTFLFVDIEFQLPNQKKANRLYFLVPWKNRGHRTGGYYIFIPPNQKESEGRFV